MDETLVAVVKEALQLAGGWREAIVELEDFCSEPVRLKNMRAAANQLDRWVSKARDAIAADQSQGMIPVSEALRTDPEAAP